MLRDLETGYFINDLKSLTTSMLAASTAQYQSLKGTPLEDPALRMRHILQWPITCWAFSDPVPPAAQAMAGAEQVLIEVANAQTISPIWDRPDLPQDMRLIEDYSQYIPRGHYTRSEDLKMYFKAMMWYGRLTFRQVMILRPAAPCSWSRRALGQGLRWDFRRQPLAEHIRADRLHRRKADDLGYIEYGALSDQVFGTSPDLGKFADASLFARFQELAKALPPPQVNSMWVWIEQDKQQVTKGFRFMGQRFTLTSMSLAR